MERLPPLNALRAFEAAGEHMSFRAAADALGVTQGAVAQHVRQLEAELGVVLFERHARGLAFTAAGRAYHGRISAAFAELRAATAQLRPEEGKVLLSVTPTFAARWMIPHLPELRDAHPEVDLQLLATEKVLSFHGDGIDLAIRQGSPPFGASLEVERLFAQQIVAVAAPQLLDEAPEHALASLPRIHDSHDLWPQFLQAAGVAASPARGLRLSQTTLAIDAALAGQGVALVSRFLVARELDEGRLRQLGDTVLDGAQDFYLLRRRGQASAAVKAVQSWLSARGAAL